MKKTFYLKLFVALSMMMPQLSMAQVPSFPGAEGYGRLTTGGRGGDVYHVTTLEDNDEPGSFRYACDRSGTRTIVFDVSGTIFLKKELKLSKGNVTIAGQTAPGDGICIADYPFTINSSNVIIRFMRFRLGNRQVAYHEGDGLGAMDQANIIVDHCSVSWSIDECLSIYGSKNTTVQWCMVSQSLRNAGHEKVSHGYGGNWGGSGASYHHNLIAHHGARTPRLGPRQGTQTDERMDMRNNVIYNHGSNGCYGGEGMNVNIVNNYYKVGPQENNHPQRIAGIGVRTSEYTGHDTDTPNGWDVMWHKWGTFYVDGNVNPDYSTVTKDNWTYGIYNEIDNSSCDNTFNDDVKRDMRLDTPIEYLYTNTHTAEKAYEKVLDYVGASLHRDALDEIIVADVRNGNATFGDNGIIDNQDQVKYSNGSTAWPELLQGDAKLDSDGDGMPDEWEIANGLDKNDATDGAKIGKDGYTNLEIYMNSLVAEIVEKGNADGKLLSGNLESPDDAVELPEYVAPVVEDWEVSNNTYKGETEATGTWTFDKNVTVTSSNAGRGYAKGSSKTNNYIKFARNEVWTVQLPEGKVANSITITGWANNDASESWLASLNDDTFDSDKYVFVSRTEDDPSSHDITFPTPANVFTLKFANAESVLMFILSVSDGDASGINNISIDETGVSTGRIFNIMGVEVSEPFAPGIYIQDSKKFIVK